MHISYISIFPSIYDSFLQTSLVQKATDAGLLSIRCVDPREYCTDRHRQIDDEIYGGGAGLLMKARPVIDAVESEIARLGLDASLHDTRKIIFVSPSQTVFTQQVASDISKVQYLIFVSGRYEGIDYRFEKYMESTYPHQFSKISLGTFVTLGGELPSMVMTEAIVRLIPGVIHDEVSHMIESYALADDMTTIEFPQYTRPEEVLGMRVPDVLLSGHHQKIQEWRDENLTKCN